MNGENALDRIRKALEEYDQKVGEAEASGEHLVALLNDLFAGSYRFQLGGYDLGIDTIEVDSLVEELWDSTAKYVDLMAFLSVILGRRMKHGYVLGDVLYEEALKALVKTGGFSREEAERLLSPHAFTLKGEEEERSDP